MVTSQAGEGARWPLGDGEMSGRIARHAWDGGPLGPIEAWPERLRSAVELMLASGFAASLQWGPEGTLLYNDATIALMAEQHPSALGRSIFDLGPEARLGLGPVLRRVLEGETVTGLQQSFRLKRNGVERDAWFTLSAMPVRDESGRAAGLLSIFVETMERIEAERRRDEVEAGLRESEARDALAQQGKVFDAMLSGMGDFVYACDLNGRFTYVNPALERVWGASRQDWLGKTREELGHPQGLVGLSERQRRLVADTGRPIAGEAFYTSPTGRSLWLDYVFSPVFAADGAVEAVVGISRDATHRKQAEAASRENAQRFRGLVEGFSQAVWETNAEGEAVADSASWRAYTGQTEAEWLGYGWLDAVHPEDRPYAQRQWREAIAAVRSVDAEFRLRSAGGGWRWTSVRAVPIYDEQGRVLSWAGMNVDVHARKLAEAALSESEERFRSFAENTADTLWIVDAESGRLEYLSPAFEAIWGESRAQVSADIGRWLDFIHPEDRAAAATAMPKVLAGAPVQQQYRIVRPSDGAVRWILDTGFPIRGEDGRVRRAAGIAQDVTARVLVEQALAESEVRLRSLVEGIPQLVWRAVDGGEWTWSSPQWTAVTGMTLEQSRGRGWLAAVHPEDRAKAAACWAEAEKKLHFEGQYRLWSVQETRYRWFATRATRVSDPGGEQAAEWLGTSTDIDQLISLQERSRLLLAELQHRVRNTLSVVRSVARRTATSSSDIEDYARHLDGRISSLARTQAAVTRDPAAGVSLEEIVSEELLVYVGRFGERTRIAGPEVRFRPKAAESLGLAVHELATNALKYGALSTREAELDVTWLFQQRDGVEWLRFEWLEKSPSIRGGAPSRRGFGTELLERTLRYDLQAETALAFNPGAFRCVVAFPTPGRLVEPGSGTEQLDAF